jgi:hypothetical protein
MTDVRWDGGAAYEITFERRSKASPIDVYGVLADLSTHLDWSGKRQYPGFRLLSLRDTGHLETGTEFTSVGSIPMAMSRWENQNHVVEARPPETLEFHTDSLVVWRSGKRTEARSEHRYEIRPDSTGARVVYRIRQTAITNPPLRMRLPLMRTMTHRVMMPIFARRGFTNMLRSAERRGATSKAEQTTTYGSTLR